MRIIHLGLAVLSFFVLASCGGGGGGGGNGFTPNRYWVSYQSVADGTLHIVRSNGADNRVINSLELTGAERPALSPDGSKVAYYKATTATTAGLFYLDLGRGNPIQIAVLDRLDEHYGPIRWRPGDGGRILYIDIWGKLWAVDVNGSNSVRLTPNSHDVWEGSGWSWSRDGTKIATDRVEGGNPGNLWIMNSDGTDQVRIASTGLFSYFTPDWVSNSRLVCYRTGQLRGLITMNTDGSGVTPISLSSEILPGQPRCSPDGSMLVFELSIAGVHGTGEVAVYNLATGGLFRGIGKGTNPDWINIP